MILQFFVGRLQQKYIEKLVLVLVLSKIVANYLCVEESFARMLVHDVGKGKVVYLSPGSLEQLGPVFLLGKLVPHLSRDVKALHQDLKVYL